MNVLHIGMNYAYTIIYTFDYNMFKPTMNFCDAITIDSKMNGFCANHNFNQS